jgi:CRP/FNR family cyclic AMP-dependent transcriptional regulator
LSDPKLASTGTMDVHNTLEKIPLFSGLKELDLKTISSHAITRNFPKNTIVITEGDITNTLYVIHSGKVKVFLNDEHGKEIILTRLEKNEYFGELSLLDGEARSASVMTLEPTTVSVISKADFDAYLINNPSVALTLLDTLTKKIRLLTENVRGLALMDVYGRVARVLLDMAKEANGKLIIDEKPSQQEIAKMVGASREMVSRILKDLSTGGYIEVERKHIVIHQKLPPAW